MSRLELLLQSEQQAKAKRLASLDYLFGTPSPLLYDKNKLSSKIIAGNLRQERYACGCTINIHRGGGAVNQAVTCSKHRA